jgi:bacterioferritin-associated ferredoxin
MAPCQTVPPGGLGRIGPGLATLSLLDGLTLQPVLGRLTGVMVCHCEAVNDAAIREEIAAGALDSDDLADRCGVGSRCGGCVSVVEQLLAQFGLDASPVAA